MKKPETQRFQKLTPADIIILIFILIMLGGVVLVALSGYIRARLSLP
jgi:hypothetical protein